MAVRGARQADERGGGGSTQPAQRGFIDWPVVFALHFITQRRCAGAAVARLWGEIPDFSLKPAGRPPFVTVAAKPLPALSSSRAKFTLSCY